MKHYVVFTPHEARGVYSSWDSCKAAVTGKGGARYVSVKSHLDGVRALRECATFEDYKTVKRGPMGTTSFLAVDAACSSNGGMMEYRGVLMPGGAEVFGRGPYARCTNNVGEFLAIVVGLRWCRDNMLKDVPVFSDSAVAIGWVTGKEKKCNTSSFETLPIEVKMEIADAESWLKSQAAKESLVNLRKWETSEWGEIPADYGRK